ncbi:MAG: alpha-mannosidase [Candidatus Sumerlaeaceae bacterium]
MRHRCLRLVLFAIFISAGAACLAKKDPPPTLPDNDLLHRKLEKLRAVNDGEQKAECKLAMKANHRYVRGGATENIQCNLHELILPASGMALTGIKLPNTKKLKLLGVTLIPAGKGTPVHVDLKSHFDTDGIAQPNEQDGGDMDGGGCAYAADVLSKAGADAGGLKALSGTVFQMPPVAPGEKNTITCAGQVITLASAAYESVHILATSTGGESSGQFSIALAKGDAPAKAKKPVFRVSVPDWCDKGRSTIPKDDFEALVKVLNEMGQGKRVQLKNMAVQLGPGAEAANTTTAQVGYMWNGEKTETTFTTTIDLAELFPGRDLSKVQAIAYAGIDDKGSIRIDGGPWQEFYGDEGHITLSEYTTPTHPLSIEIHGRNETGSGKLMHADVTLEVPEIREYEKLVTEARAFATMAEQLPDGAAHAERTMNAIAQSLDVVALNTHNTKALQAAVTDLRKRLQPLSGFAKKRHMFLVGYSHIDLAWLWPLSETIDSVIPLTFKQALRFMEEFPDFHFSMTQAQQYDWVEKTDPAMFAEITKRVKSGQWELLGGMWSEPDCNLPNGESFVRQVLYGKRYFLDKFGYDSRVAMNPDSFGYNWQLAQILKKGGFDAFVTQKISWNDTWKFPYKLFWWQAPDDSRLLAYFPVGSYGENVDINATAGQMATFENMTTGIQDMMVIYGVGDHGGGPTRAMINRGHQIGSSPILPEVQMGTAAEYFASLQKNNVIPSSDAMATAKQPRDAGHTLPVWKDELYLERHRGTYTTHEDAKDGNRRSERMLYNAELAAALAWLGPKASEAPAGKPAAGNQEDALRAVGGPPAHFPMEPSQEIPLATMAAYLPEETTYPAALFTQAWRDVCLLHMHDILPGSSIHQVYRDARRLYMDLHTSVGRTIVSALSHVAGHNASPNGGAESRVLFNLLPWDRTAVCVVSAPAGAPIATDGNGEALLQQRLPEQENKLAVSVNVPAGGYKTITFVKGEEVAATTSNNDVLENAFVRARIDRKTGNLSSLVEKITGTEMIGQYTTESRVIKMPTTQPEAFDPSLVFPTSAGPQANILQVHGDYPTEYDAWEIGLTGKLDEMTTTAVVSECTSGALFAQITVTKNYGTSKFQQTYRLYVDQPYLEVLNDINWHERHRMVKVAFPLSIQNKWANYEVPFGAIDRPAVRTAPEELGKYEHSGIQWGNYDDASGKVGLALLTMNKYGFDAKDNVLRLSLLRGPDSPNTKADEGKPLTEEGRHRFSYAIFPHAGTWKQADVVRRGYEYNHSVIPMQGAAATGDKSLIKLQPSNVILSSLKKAEDDDSIIVRLYEAEGTDVADTQLELPWEIASVESCDIVERVNTPVTKTQKPARADGRTLHVPINHYEIATYKVHLRK